MNSLGVLSPGLRTCSPSTSRNPSLGVAQLHHSQTWVSHTPSHRSLYFLEELFTVEVTVAVRVKGGGSRGRAGGCSPNSVGNCHHELSQTAQHLNSVASVIPVPRAGSSWGWGEHILLLRAPGERAGSLTGWGLLPAPQIPSGGAGALHW